jgi:dATP pyrophosphohydrolase
MSSEAEPADPYARDMRTGVEVAVFVTRKSDAEVLIVHRSPEQGGYWHVVAGGVEPAETVVEAAERELQEETGLVAKVTGGFDVIEYVDVLTKEPADRTSHDPRVAEIAVTCFHVNAPDEWEPKLDWEHDRHRWCDPEEAFDSLRWPGTAHALRKLLAVKSD